MTAETVRAFLESELGYVVLLFALFVVPKFLQRYRLPSAITSFALGAAASISLDAYTNDPTIRLLASFGIVGLFLFAGLDAEVEVLRAQVRPLLRHLVVRVVLLVAGTVAAVVAFDLGTRAGILVSLALLTPSTGFILDSLGQFRLTPDEQSWVKSTAVATELLALLALFVTLQSTTIIRLTGASVLLIALILVLPPAFRFFARSIAPFAPKSEFAFLLMMALVAAVATRKLGVYYLVGAFVVGFTAQRFRESLPALASERMLHGIEVFASFFAPFYFFNAGASLRASDLSATAFGVGVALLLVFLPLRLGTIAAVRRWYFGEPFRNSLRVAMPKLPTLIFTLVIAGILREAFGIPGWLYGALIVYTILNTLIPGLLFKAPTPDYESPELPPAPNVVQAPDPLVR